MAVRMACPLCDEAAHSKEKRMTTSGVTRRYECRLGHRFNTIEKIIDKSIDTQNDNVLQYAHEHSNT